MNNPQNEVETRIDESLTEARNVLIGTVLKGYSLLLPRKVLNLHLTASHLLLAYPHHPPSVILLKAPSTLTLFRPILLPLPLLLNVPIPLLYRASILPCHCSLLGPFNPPPIPLPPPLHPQRLPLR